MMLTETKISDHYHCRNRMGYNVVWLKAITMADGDAQGRVGMIVQDRPQFCIIELTRFHGPNELSFDFITGKQTHLIRTYPPLHLGAPSVLGGGPETLLGPKSHSVRGTQRQHPIPEPPQSTGCWAPDGVWVGGPPTPSQKYWRFYTGKVVLDAERHIVGGNIWRHLWVRWAPRWRGGNKGREEVYTRALFRQSRLSYPTETGQ